MLATIVAWVVLVAIPGGLLYLLARTDLVQKALEWYFKLAVAVCGTAGLCVVLWGFLLPTAMVYALLRLKIFRKDKEPQCTSRCAVGC